MSRRTRRAAAGRLLGAALLVWLLTGCGVTTEDEPEPIDPTMVPLTPTPTVTVVPDTPATRPAVDLVPPTPVPGPVLPAPAPAPTLTPLRTPLPTPLPTPAP
ncbi:hypothetical protein ACL02T_32645 [Pseudonocardia sp. RS010]|uniref:hypothetical protein n=1 Tax=Pseudonocardia sp. RS010 TaxID=3385979 RepID=UPI0039A391E5